MLVAKHEFERAMGQVKNPSRSATTDHLESGPRPDPHGVETLPQGRMARQGPQGHVIAFTNLAEGHGWDRIVPST